MVVILEHLFTYDVADRVDHEEEVVGELFLLLHAGDYLLVSGLARSFDEELGELVEDDAFVFFLEGLEAVLYLHPVDAEEVLLACRGVAFLNFR